jgi:Fe-S-cluster containining protein
VEVERGAPLLSRKDLVKKLVTKDEGGVLHLRLDGSGRCLALSGTLGVRVSCRIYSLRPAACRRVEPGAADCLRYREARGIA